MVALSAGLLASVLLLQPAAATFNWGAAKPFKNPTNNDNICNDQQKGGFNWKDLPTGRVSNFGDFDFSGFDCKDSFSGRNGRRALQARNGFQQKVIEGKCTADKATSPKISCGSDKNFSIKDMQITVEFDTDIDFEYTMPDGSSCRQTQKCSAGGSTISNRQCGGAKEVTFKRPQSGRDCKIGIHKVEFDCEGAPPPPPPPPPPSTTTQSTTSTQSTTATTDLPKTLTSTTSEIPNSVPSTTSEPSKTAPSTTTAPETVSTTSEQVTTELTFVTLTTCDVTLTQTTNNITLTRTTQTLSTTTLTSTVTFCPKCGESVPTKPGQPPSPPSSTSGAVPPPPPSSTAEAPPPPPATSKTGESTTPAPSTLKTSTVLSSTSAVPPPPPPPPADTPQSPCPETLPRCMNTWLSLAKCTSNSDTKCMCPNSEFTKNVISCVTAWGASDKEVQAALSYFAGICAEFVPQNPGICTDVPTSITLIPTITPTATVNPSPASSTGQVKPEGPKGSTPAQEVPCTTITLVDTITATAGGAVQTTTKFITVPQVTFVTGEAAPAPPATAVDGAAAPIPVPAQPSIGLVPMPQLVQAGPTTSVPAGGAAAPSSTNTGGAVPAGGPVAAPSGTGSAQNPQVSIFKGAAVKNGALVGGAGLLAVVAFAL